MFIKSFPKSVSTITPQRISFSGGGTDFPNYFREHEGHVLSSTIDKYLYVTVKKHSSLFNESYRLSYFKTEHVDNINDIENDIARECLKLVPYEPPIYISTTSDLPASSGLGSSSSFAVGLLHALHVMRGEKISIGQLAEEACEVEINKLGRPIGKQDQYSVAFGGLNFISFHKNNRVSIDQIWKPGSGSEFLFKDLILLWTGLQRNSADILLSQQKNIHQTKDILHEIKNLALDMRDLVLDSNNRTSKIGEILDKNWNLKRNLSDNISNQFIDQNYSKAKSLGAYGGKIVGAGGGGFLMLIVPKENRKKIIKGLPELVFTPIQYEPEGTRILSVVS